MPLLETIALALGAAIAKAILKSWGLQTDLANAPVDLLKVQIEKVLTGRDKGREIEKLGAQIAARMRPLFEHEGAKLTEDERALVAQEVALTLAQSKITTSLVVEHRLDAQRLARHLLDTRPEATATLSAAESALYQRMLTEAAGSIVSIATELAGFERALATAQLASDDKILAGITRLLEQPDQQAREFEDRYCRAIRDKLDRMDIFGVPDVDPLVRRQSLSVAYITLDVDQSKAEQDKPDSEPIVREPFQIFGSFTRLPDGKIVLHSGPVDQILPLSRRLVIRGQAGSGKSTLMHWVAVRSASHDFPPNLGHWNETVPFFVRLRTCVNTGFPSPEEFPRQVAPMIAGDTPRGWVHDQLDCGRAVVLVDGVDELPREQRGAMLERLQQLVASYPLARYIVTSRPAALKAEDWPEWQDWIKQEGFVELNLQPMTSTQIESFVDHWHTALAQALSDQAEREELKSHPASLKRLLRQRLPLRRLATSPLLCAMICALYRERRQSLPAERIELYRQCVEMLLSGREQIRKINQGDYPNLSHAQRLTLIQSFAYWLMRNGYSDVETAQADTHFEDKLALMNLPGVTGAGVRRLFVERTSLLREPVAGRIDFTHRTFQEYMAAQAAINASDMGVLIKNSLDDQWHETIILAAGEARPKESEKLLNGLIAKGDKLKRERNRHQSYLLACACLETCVELAPQVRQAVLDKAATLIPPQDSDEVKLIAAAGNPIVHLLVSRPDYLDEQAAQCIDTLAMIGTDQAMQTIISYTSDTSDKVISALGRAWGSFDRSQYAQQVLAHSDRLIVENLSSWEGFEHFVHLRSLNLKNSQLTDLSPLMRLEQLVHLDLESWPLLRDISPLGQLGSLTLIFLINMPQLDDLGSLIHLTQLRSLLLDRCKKVNDLALLANLPNLTELALWSMQIRDYTPIANLGKLTQLEIAFGSQLPDLTFLTNFPNLIELCFMYTSLDDLAPLTNIVNLKKLDIRSTQIKDLNPLVTLSALEELDIQETQVSDLSPLTRLTNLARLDIRSTQVSDLSPLSHLQNLKQLVISIDSNIDLSPLQGTSGLKIVKS